MKNLIYITITLGFLTIFSCQDQLETKPLGILTEKEVTTNPTLKTLENSVTFSYQLLGNTLNILGEWLWKEGLVFQNDYIIQDIASDDMEKKWNLDGDQSWMDEINNYTFSSSNGGPNGYWKYNYEGITRANRALKLLLNPNIESITGISTQRKNQLFAEVYFIRSFYYFGLVNNFGDVPLILKPVDTYQEAFDVAVRVDKNLVFEQIKKDLVLAENLLPNTKYSSTTEKWRVSKGAVMALQAKIDLYTKDWSNVINKVTELENTGFYALNTNYFDAFYSEYTDNEVIFSFNHEANQNPRKGNGICAPLDWGFFAPSTDFLNTFEPNDPRKLYTVDITNKNVNKMLGSINGTNKGNDEAPNNKVYIRYADVLLWKAEAYLETGDLTNAILYINKIRQRARNTIAINGNIPPAGTLLDRPNSTDKTTVKNWLIHERRVELGFESQRMLDLKRWGIAKQVMQAHGKNYQDKNNLYPIPESEISTSSGTLTQNPGY